MFSMHPVLQEKSSLKYRLKQQLILLYFLNIFDLIATTVWIIMFGLGIESNPLGRVLFQGDAVYLYKTIGIGIMEFILYKEIQKHPQWKWVVGAMICVYAAIAIYHLLLSIQVVMILC